MIWSHPLFVPVALSASIIVILGYCIYLHLKLQKFLRGKNAHSLEDSITHMIHDIEKMHHFQKESLAYFEEIEDRLSRSIQAVKTVRFNPFKGTGEGGNQSFSTAFINENGDGVVISSLYSRDRVSIFSKPIAEFQSEFELTEEERGVVDEAKTHIS